MSLVCFGPEGDGLLKVAHPDVPDASFRPAACAVYTQAMACERDDLLPISLEPSDVIDAYKGGIDRTLLRENLKLTPAERVTKMLSALRFAEAVRHSGRKASQR